MPPAPPPASPDVESTIRQVAARAGFAHPDLLVATAHQESNLDPTAAGDYAQGVPHSIGVFQENDRGRGYGLSAAQRQDVAAATQRAIDEFTAIRARFPTVSPGEWAARAQRPANPGQYAQAINTWLGQLHAPGTAAAPTVSSGPPAAGTPGPAAGVGPVGVGAMGVPDWYRQWAGSQGASAPSPAATPVSTTASGTAAGLPDWYRQWAAGQARPASSSQTAPGDATPFSGMPVQGSVITHSGQPSWSFGGGPHAGIDIASRAGTPIRSPVAGTVVAALALGQNPLGLSAGYGRAVAVKDGAGNVHVFGHGSPDFQYLPVGTPVGVGDTISLVGSPKTKLPGEATEGEHLHWEIRGGGSYANQVDPEQWLKQQTLPATNQPERALTQHPSEAAVPDWYRQWRQQQGSPDQG